MTQIATTTTAAATTATAAPDTSRLASKDNLKKAGQQFEAVFVGMMMKSMRQAKLADPLFDSKAIDTFRDMQDQKVAQSITEHAPLGIGKAMTDFLAKSQQALTDAGANGSASVTKAQDTLNQPDASPSP